MDEAYIRDRWSAIIRAAQMTNFRLPMICRNMPRRVGSRSETIGRAGG
jgi:hypothetical protein